MLLIAGDGQTEINPSSFFFGFMGAACALIFASEF
jgi:hypothetical protein